MVNGNFREYKLDNGLVVALQNTPTQTAVAKLRVNYGSSHESPGEEGLAHFLEHCLVTGGSKKFDPTTADEIRSSFRYTNAYTNIGRTCFDVHLFSEDLENWLEYISDHIFNPLFDEDRVNGERARVLREISDRKSHTAYLDYLKLGELFYRGHPKQIEGLGKEDVIKNVNLEKIAAFHRRGYAPNNIDLLIAGGLPGNIDEIVRLHFGSSSSGENMRRNFPRLMPLENKTIIHSLAPEKLNRENPEQSSAFIGIKYLGPITGEDDEYSIRVLSDVLGTGSTSLLFKNLGLKKGLAYSTDTYIHGDYNAGEMGVEASVHAGRIEEAIQSIFEELEKLKTEKMPSRTIDMLKKSARYSIATAFETNSGHINAIERKLDDDLTPETFLRKFNEVTPESVIRVANKYLPDRENGKYIIYIRDPLKSD